MFDRFSNRVLLKAILVAETGLHIGAGASLEPVGSDSPVIRDGSDRPFIPGSSFKGVLRSIIERLVRGVNPRRDGALRGCDIIQEPCVTKERVRNLKKQYRREGDRKYTESLIKETCSVCRLFGSPWIASKVLIKDLHIPPESEWLGTFEVRDGVGIDRDTETAAHRVKYDFEVVAAGTEFQLEMVIENASDAELGLLFIGLREFENGRASLGGLTSRGLGKAKLSWQSIEVIGGSDGNSLIEYLRTGKGKEVTSEEAIKRFINEKIEAFIRELRGGSDAQAATQ